MFKVVIVSPTPTHPIDFGNRKRIHRMAKGLQDAGCHVSFVLYPLEGDWRQDVPIESYNAMHDEWDEFHVVVPTVPYHPSAEDEDHHLDDWWDNGLEKFLWWYLRGRHVDAVIVNYIYLSRALTLVPKSTLKILDTHDRFGGRRTLLSQLGIKPEFFHINTWDEGIGINRADVTIAIKPEEETYFRELGATTALTVPFSEPPVARKLPAPDPDQYLRVGMIGGRNSINRASTSRFLKSFLPRVFSTMAPIKLVIAGTMCADMKPYRNKYCVELMGPVDDVSEFYENVDLVIVPMEISTGQKIKVGEAIGRGVPVISMAHAFEGYVPSHPLHSLKSIDEMVEACIDMSFDKSKLPALASASEMASRAQESTVQSSMEELVNLIAYHKPRALIRINGERFIADPFFRAHILTIFQFVKELCGLVAAFEFNEPVGNIPSEAANVMKKMRRSARLVQIFPGSEETLETIMKGTWVHSVFDYGADALDIASVAPGWSGLLMECSTFLGHNVNGNRLQAHRPTQLGTDSVFQASIGTAADLRSPLADQRVFPAWIYASDIIANGFSDKLLCETHAVYAFIDNPKCSAMLVEVAKLLKRSKSFGTVIIVCPSNDVFDSVHKSIKSVLSGITLKHFNPTQPDFNALVHTPAFALDMAPYIEEGTFLREALFQLGVPNCRWRHARIENHVEVEPAIGELDMLRWVNDLLTNYTAGQPAPTNIARKCTENGYSALYNFLTETFTLLASTSPRRELPFAKAS